MRIVLDGMGGDNAPQEIVKGAVAAAELIDHEIIIVGPVELIQSELDKCKYKGDKISIREANDVITMEDSPVRAIRKKTDSTLVVGLNMLKDKQGDILECVTPGEADLRAWAGGIFRKNGFSVSGRTLALFLEFTGEDMQNIAGEAEKLCCYCMGKNEITDQDIKDVCSPRIRDRIFDMIEAIALRDRKKALGIYMELCALRTAPQVILSLMRRQFGQLVKIKELSGTMPDGEIASKVGVPPFVITKKYKPALKMYSTEELIEALSDCIAADHDSKSGRIDAGIAAEMIIVRHSGRA